MATCVELRADVVRADEVDATGTEAGTVIELPREVGAVELVELLACVLERRVVA